MNATVTLYGPTMPAERDRSVCEACGQSIGYRDLCYVFDIGGGVAVACVPCGERDLASGHCVLSADSPAPARYQPTRRRTITD